jgi:hypothetical protein
MPDDALRVTLRRVLDELSDTLLTVVCGRPSGSVALGGVAFHDPVDDAYLPQNALVLGIGLHDPDEMVALLDRLGEARAVGLVVRSPVHATEELRAAAHRSGVVLIGLARGASWAQLAAMVRSLSLEDRVGADETDTLGGVASGDLFALANAITAMIDAPITILDRSSRVLAFSGRQDEGDASRIETILGRQVPERFTSAFVERGLFNELYRSDQPVWIDPGPPGTDLPRVAAAVRAGDEVLGSIWAVVREPLSAERAQALTDASKLVALHMMRIRGGSHGAQQLRTDLVSTALGGGPAARDALRRLGVADEAVLVLALGLVDSGEESVERHARHRADLQRLSAGFAMHLTAVHPRCATALIEDTCYALMPVGARPGPEAEGRAVRVASDFLTRVTDGEKAPTASYGCCSISAGRTDRSHDSRTSMLRRCCWSSATWSRPGVTGPRVRWHCSWLTTRPRTPSSSTPCGRGSTPSAT